MTEPRPLEGIRIIECAVWHAGPGAAAILADLGAEVIKVETMKGDPERQQQSLGAMTFEDIGDPEWSFLFELSNRNKQGICIDTTTSEGRAIFDALLRTADVFLTNLRAATRPKLGLDYDTIRAIQPEIIYASVSGFGTLGPMKDVGGFDPMGQAISGMMFLASPDEPVLLQSVLLDQMTSITLSHAVMTALFVRERHGYGQEVQTSLYSAALWLTHSNVLATGILGQNPLVRWDRYHNPALRNCYRCADGQWLMGTNHPEQKYWQPFCEAIGKTDLAHSQKFATIALRSDNNRELIELLDRLFETRSRSEWVALLQQAGLMFAPVHKLTDVVSDQQAAANDYIVDYDHPTLGAIRIPGYPINFSRQTAGTHGPAPTLGEHTDPILTSLGFSSADIDRLREKGIVD